MVEDSLYGPTVLWGLLKGKKVKSNDGKVLWLLTGEEETRAKFQYGEEPPVEQYERDFGSFKTSSYGQNRTWDAEKVKVAPERTVGISTKPADSNENYKNIRDLK